MATGATIFGAAGPRLDRAEAAFFRAAEPWGFILFDRNLKDPAQIHALCADLRASVGRDAPILIDQEGGRVARLRPPLATAWPPAIGEMARPDPERGLRALSLRYRVIAAELRSLGIDANCAPLGDVATDQTHPVVRNRCYGTDAETVAIAARVVAGAHLALGVLPILKHIPGHGRPLADSHDELPRTDAGLADLTATDFAAFAALADLPIGMTAHVVYAALDPDLPATLSPRVLAHVRDVIGFGGLLMSDDISMGALAAPIGTNTAAALKAGCDIVLHCNAKPAEMEAVAANAGQMSGQAQARAEAALVHRGGAEEVDIAALLAEYAGLGPAGGPAGG